MFLLNLGDFFRRFSGGFSNNNFNCLYTKNLKIERKKKCPHAGSNYRPSVYKTDALPLSYRGKYDTNLNRNYFSKYYLKIILRLNK